MKGGRSNTLACQVGEYLVCAELARRDVIATPFSHNVPKFDVLATDEFCRTVPIQVKASRGKKWQGDARHWMQIHYDDRWKKQIYSGPKKLETPDLIWVCVAIAAPGDRDRFFVLTEADLQGVCERLYRCMLERIAGKRPVNPESYDLRYSVEDLTEFEDNWSLITERLAAAEPDTSLG